ncbi:hypothetical protein Goarm_002156 [Gossypium armourianum]|uniref:Uncharacterized protein n=1 Tax=Gossypium armourianum TaxID=34283 RepID=A0A7J9K771_9ROSI|nr:hypothetical protein [Gossypium armourianum]
MGSTSNGVSSTQKVGKSLSLPHAAVACAAPLASCGMNWNSKFWKILHIAIISFITPSKIDLSFPWLCSFLMMVLESLSMQTSLKSHFFSKNGSLEACIQFSGCQISNVVDRVRTRTYYKPCMVSADNSQNYLVALLKKRNIKINFNLRF